MIRRPPRSTLFPLHDALPISKSLVAAGAVCQRSSSTRSRVRKTFSEGLMGSLPVTARSLTRRENAGQGDDRSEEHTSELQSRQYLVCRLLLEKKKKMTLCDDY